MKDQVEMIPLDQIHILNARDRDKGKFDKVVQSIKNLGLKKPIKVSRRVKKNGEEAGYDLVFGQGRIEAFKILGYNEIPAIVVEVSREDCLLMSLIENMARRFPATMDLINEIERLKNEGYSNVAIGKKLDLENVMVGGLLALKQSGEERLLDAALKGKIPMGVAIEIARTEGVETQRELLKAYENGQLNQAAIRTLKRLIEQRRFLGKSLHATHNEHPRKKPRTTAEGLVNAYRKESQRQKAMIKKARVCEGHLLFLVTAFKQLMADENFVNLLRAEGLDTMPKFLAHKIA